MRSAIKLFIGTYVLAAIGLLPAFVASQDTKEVTPADLGYPFAGGSCNRISRPGDWACGLHEDDRSQYLCGEDNRFVLVNTCDGEGNSCVDRDEHDLFFMTAGKKDGVYCRHQWKQGTLTQPAHTYPDGVL